MSPRPHSISLHQATARAVDRTSVIPCDPPGPEQKDSLGGLGTAWRRTLQKGTKEKTRFLMK